MRATFTVNTNKFNVTATPFVKTFRVTASSVGRQGINGKSAYQIALDNGFVGTEQEFLDRNLDGGIIY